MHEGLEERQVDERNLPFGGLLGLETGVRAWRTQKVRRSVPRKRGTYACADGLNDGAGMVVCGGMSVHAGECDAPVPRFGDRQRPCRCAVRRVCMHVDEGLVVQAPLDPMVCGVAPGPARCRGDIGTNRVIGFVGAGHDVAARTPHHMDDASRPCCVVHIDVERVRSP